MVLTKWTSLSGNLLALSFLLTLGIPHLSGCTTSQIVDTPIAPKAPLLGESTRYSKRREREKPKVSLQLELSEEISERLGSQYFLFLPLGKTTSGELEAHSFNVAYSHLNALGYEVLLEKSQEVPTLHIRIEDVSITTYDLIVSRLVKSSVRISAQWDYEGGKLTYSSAERSQYIRLPFSKEVTQQYRMALTEALQRAISLPNY